MKCARIFLAVLVMAASHASASAQAPAVSAREAIEIAEKTLTERGLSREVFIEAVTLDHSSILGGQQFWFVKWSKTLPARNPRNKEVGMKVYMDGRAVLLVKEPPGAGS